MGCEDQGRGGRGGRGGGLRVIGTGAEVDMGEIWGLVGGSGGVGMFALRAGGVGTLALRVGGMGMVALRVGVQARGLELARTGAEAGRHVSSSRPTMMWSREEKLVKEAVEDGGRDFGGEGGHQRRDRRLGRDLEYFIVGAGGVRLWGSFNVYNPWGDGVYICPEIRREGADQDFTIGHNMPLWYIQRKQQHRQSATPTAIVPTKKHNALMPSTIPTLPQRRYL